MYEMDKALVSVPGHPMPLTPPLNKQLPMKFCLSYPKQSHPHFLPGAILEKTFKRYSILGAIWFQEFSGISLPFYVAFFSFTPKKLRYEYENVLQTPRRIKSLLKEFISRNIYNINQCNITKYFGKYSTTRNHHTILMSKSI